MSEWNEAVERALLELEAEVARARAEAAELEREVQDVDAELERAVEAASGDEGEPAEPELARLGRRRLGLTLAYTDLCGRVSKAARILAPPDEEERAA